MLPITSDLGVKNVLTIVMKRQEKKKTIRRNGKGGGGGERMDTKIKC